MKKIFFFVLFFLIIFINIDKINNYLNANLFKKHIPSNITVFLKEKIFVHYNQQILKKIIKQQDSVIKNKDLVISNLINKQINNFGILFEKIDKIETINIDNNIYTLKKFKTELFPYSKSSSQINYKILNFKKKNLNSKSSAYLDIYRNNLFIISGTGIIGFNNLQNIDKNKVLFNLLPSNLNHIIQYEKFYTSSKYGVKDLLLHNEKIYISFTNEKEKDCFNTAILIAELNLNFLEFKNFFNPDQCIHKENTYGEFSPHQSGGKMIAYNNKIIFAIGEFRNRDLAQKKDNPFGKIISIDINNSKKYEIISMGHRNQQGLAYSNSNIIISTEHGPQGGDEININFLDNIEIKNFGWPIASYGEHYGFAKQDMTKNIYKKAPLHKSHLEYGFIEPLKYFTPSIGISEIIEVPKKFLNNGNINFLVSSLGYDNEIAEGDQSIHLISLNKDLSLNKHFVLPLYERIRDMKYSYDENKIYLYFENSSSIGLIEKN